ncbi:DUF1835 domain-containing protein [Clostridium botulinum]|uniref:DUF1835 domain-containing protein n=1 Tax=Clostridium botulinum C/D str. DC5 TaxID=1443128 RepID=A0A0A0IKZ8_CLOBO|nr:DUF1835 domain-containing protein [Clostridium botulinum]KEI05461.1 hypothetical protein Z952_05305 [Clostridium botulinum C/D str. BKT75002]KEI09412.1 hypothetical protein Z954_12835 [Clostridium botulinum C/D str. BKT2873]KGM94407.1 hypothetical protein Z956_07795 [Clostridium botulinum D str. CCUG 7971]KGN00226.1 hypothetical protein Z955_04315 [Clostridium botulinum C/D str. DC5]KOC50619.1 hypothetical protein ADU88_01705 [Clostridium botulinum]
MNNVIHMCFSASASGSLKVALKQNIIKGNRVIPFYDNLSEGKIGDLKNLEDRIEWYKNIDCEEDISKQDVYQYKRDYERYRKKVSKLTDNDIIYIWYGECSTDICGMMYVLELLKDKLPKIYLINVSNLIEENQYHAFITRSVSEIMSEDMNKYIEFKKILDKDTYKYILEEWGVLKKENTMLRIFENGKVKSANKDYFDLDILKNTDKNLKRAARTVGNVLGFSNQNISDDYIFWRVRELINLGYIEYTGEFGIMRKMEIKITNKGLDRLSNDEYAMEFWRKREDEIEKETEYLRAFAAEAALKEKLNIARNLLDVLDIKVIAEKTGLTIGQVKNLKVDI